MRAGHQLHRIRQVGFTGDLPMVTTIEPDDLRKHMSITCIGLRARGGVPLPIPRRGQRVDHKHLITGRPQGGNPRAPVVLDSHDHLSGDIFWRQLRPARGCMLGDQCMEPRDALQSFRQASSCQSTPGRVLELKIVVIFGPVVPDEQQHLQQLLHARWTRITAPGDTCNLMNKCSRRRRARHPISSPVTGEPAGARSPR